MEHLDKNLKEKTLRRAKIVEGQFKALVLAIDNERYCIEVLTQLKAIQSSLKGMGRMVLDNHIKSHVRHMIENKTEKERAVKELIGLLEISDKYN